MDHDQIDHLRKHPAWSLLRANNAALVLSFLTHTYIDRSAGNISSPELVSRLDDHLFAVNQQLGEERYPRSAKDYLEEWADAEHGWLRRFYPPGSDEPHFDLTPAAEKAAAWVDGLGDRTFIGTESRLTMLIELLRQLVVESDDDPAVRLADLRRRRDALDEEIERIETGGVAAADPVVQRDRYQQFARSARELLSDFREVEENFRTLDRDLREKIAGWSGSKGELLDDVVATRSGIAESDQGRSFRAFYELLLTGERQDELTDLLHRLHQLEDLPDLDQRLARVHYDWIDASERTQGTVRQLSEQLRRFLDDQVWMENRRVLELVRTVEGLALDLREAPPPFGLEVDLPGIEIALPFERPLYQTPAAVAVESVIATATEQVDTDLLFTQTFIDQARLAEVIRSALPANSSALLSDVIALNPIEQGAAEIVGYLTLTDEDVSVEMDPAEETVLDYPDPADPDITRRARLPKVTVRRQ